MKTFDIFGQLEFSDERPLAYPLLADSHHRILRFALKPNQQIKEHQAPSSTVVLVVLQGKGIFKGENFDCELGPNSLVVSEQGEKHLIQALDEELVFVAILNEAP